ncbi:MAG: hypothetical protein L0Z53_05360, partial [Acidobacteriales bacterium]|nr:hypothetical protein [Terriglobales bacterium]
MKRTIIYLCLALAASLCVKGSAGTISARTQRSVNSYEGLPLIFEPNRGQAGEQVKFLSRGTGYTAFFAETESVFSLASESGDALVRMRLLGANPSPQIEGLEELPGKTNYFIGNDPARWRTNVPQYARICY